MLFLHFYSRFYVPLHYLILQSLKVLNKNWKWKTKIILKYLSRLLLVYYNNYNLIYNYNIIIIYLALIRLLYCRARAETNQNKIHKHNIPPSLKSKKWLIFMRSIFVWINPHFALFKKNLWRVVSAKFLLVSISKNKSMQ